MVNGWKCVVGWVDWVEADWMTFFFPVAFGYRLTLVLQIRWVVDLHVVTAIARTSHSPNLVSIEVYLTPKFVGRRLIHSCCGLISRIIDQDFRFGT